jgi:hypothetical protein
MGLDSCPETSVGIYKCALLRDVTQRMVPSADVSGGAIGKWDSMVVQKRRKGITNLRYYGMLHSVWC